VTENVTDDTINCSLYLSVYEGWV